MRATIALILVFIGILLTRHFYFYTNKVDRGSAYGFEIGMPKEEAIQVISNLDCGAGCEVILSENNSKNSVSNIKRSSNADLFSIPTDEFNVWQIRYKGSEKNVLVLEFQENGLKYILRYRRLWIL